MLSASVTPSCARSLPGSSRVEGIAQLVGVAQDLEHERVALRHERAQALSRADDDLPDGHASCSAKRLAQQGVGLGALRFGREEVRRVEVADRDVFFAHGAEHVDRARGVDVGRGEVLIGDGDPAPVG